MCCLAPFQALVDEKVLSAKRNRREKPLEQSISVEWERGGGVDDRKGLTNCQRFRSAPAFLSKKGSV